MNQKIPPYRTVAADSAFPAPEVQRGEEDQLLWQ